MSEWRDDAYIVENRPPRYHSAEELEKAREVYEVQGYDPGDLRDGDSTPHIGCRSPLPEFSGRVRLVYSSRLDRMRPYCTGCSNPLDENGGEDG